MSKKYNISDISKLILRDITVNDDLVSIIEKTNYNFDQILQFTDVDFSDYIVNQSITKIATGNYSNVVNSVNNSVTNNIQWIGKPGQTGPIGPTGIGKDGSQIYVINDVILNYSPIITLSHKENDLIIDGTSMMSKVIKISEDGADKFVYVNQFKLNQATFKALTTERDYYLDGVETDHFILYDDVNEKLGSNNLIFATKEDLASLFYRLSIGVDHNYDDYKSSLTIANIPIERNNREDVNFASQLKFKYRKNWISGIPSSAFGISYKEKYLNDIETTIEYQKADLSNSSGNGISFKSYLIDDLSVVKNTAFVNARNVKFIGNNEGSDDDLFDSYFMIRVDDLPNAKVPSGYEEVSPNATTIVADKKQKEILLYSNKELRIAIPDSVYIILDGDVKSKKSFDIAKDLSVTGAVKFLSTLTITGITTGTKANFTNLDVSEITNLDTLNVGGNVTVAGESTFNSNVYIDNIYSTVPETKSGAENSLPIITLHSNSKFIKNVDIILNLGVSGNSTFNTVSASGEVRFGSKFYVGEIYSNSPLVTETEMEKRMIYMRDHVKFDKTISVVGDSTFSNIFVSGTAKISGNLTLDNDLTVKNITVYEVLTSPSIRTNVISGIAGANQTQEQTEVSFSCENVVFNCSTEFKEDSKFIKSVITDTIKSDKNSISLQADLDITGNVTAAKSFKVKTYEVYTTDTINKLNINLSAKDLIISKDGSIKSYTSKDVQTSIFGITPSDVLSVGSTILQGVNIVTESGKILTFNNVEVTTRTIVNSEYIKKGLKLRIQNALDESFTDQVFTGTDITINTANLGLPQYNPTGRQFFRSDGSWQDIRQVPSVLEGTKVLGFRYGGEYSWYNLTDVVSGGSYDQVLASSGGTGSHWRTIPSIPLSSDSTTYNLVTRYNSIVLEKQTEDVKRWFDGNGLSRYYSNHGYNGNSANCFSIQVYGCVATLTIAKYDNSVGFSIPWYLMPSTPAGTYPRFEGQCWVKGSGKTNYTTNWTLSYNAGNPSEGGRFSFNNDHSNGFMFVLTWVVREGISVLRSYYVD